MLPYSLKQIILDYKYSLETHENHTRLMLQLKEFSYYRILESICLNKFLVSSLERLELEFEARVNNFVAEVTKFEAQVSKFVGTSHEWDNFDVV